MNNAPANLQYNQEALICDATALKAMLATCEAVRMSGLLPDFIKTKEEALVTVLRGRELGLPFMSSLSGAIYIIGGKTELNGQLILAKVHEAGIRVDVVEWTDLICTLKFVRADGSEQPYSFAYEEAVAWGLANRHNWKTKRRDMLYWRALSRGGRREAPESLLGCYAPGEIQEATEQPTDDELKDAAVADVKTIVDAADAKSTAADTAKADRIARDEFTEWYQQADRDEGPLGELLNAAQGEFSVSKMSQATEEQCNMMRGFIEARIRDAQAAK